MRVRVGRRGYLQEAEWTPARWRRVSPRTEAAGNSVVVVSRGQGLLGAIALGDKIRMGAIETVAALKQQQLTPVLVTGDNRTSSMRSFRLGFIVGSGVYSDW